MNFLLAPAQCRLSRNKHQRGPLTHNARKATPLLTRTASRWIDHLDRTHRATNTSASRRERQL